MTEPTRETLIERHRVSAAGHFEHALARFVDLYAPEDPHDHDEFQRHLMMLFRHAMQSQAETFSDGVEHYASIMLRNASLAPLQAIFIKPAGTEGK